MNLKPDCFYCRKDNQDEIVGENKSAVAYICYWPLKDFHIITIPKRHIESLSEFSESEAKDFLTLCEQMQDLVKKNISEDEEPFLFRNYGKCSTQNHIHFHIVPSRGCLRDLVSKNDGVSKKVWKDEEEMLELAKKLKK